MNDLGTVTTTGDHATLTFERRLRFPIEKVWSAITDPREREAWLGTTHIDDGTIVIEPEDPPAPAEAKRVTGRILTWQPPDNGHAVFEHEWRQRIVEDSVVRYELTADGDDTLLTFTHRGLSERNALGFVPGTIWSPMLAGTEFFGGLLLAIGFLTRPAALAATVVLLVTVWFHWIVQSQGFSGAEKSILWAAITFYFFAHGGGPYSVDRAMRREI